VLATPAKLRGDPVPARIVGETKATKINVFDYKPMSNTRRRFAHRQTYPTIEITGNTRG
jgi:ribosomal protein L21